MPVHHGHRGFYCPFPNSTYILPFLDCSTTSVLCGTKLPMKQGTKGYSVLLTRSSVRSATFTSPYIKTPMPPLPPVRPPFPPTIQIRFCPDRGLIHFSTSSDIGHPRPLAFLLPAPVLSLSPPNLMATPLPSLTTPHLPVAPLCDSQSPRKQKSLQDGLAHPTRLQLVKSERALRPP
jgi:hypothetical protein